jgi:hypothetical protein
VNSKIPLPLTLPREIAADEKSVRFFSSGTAPSESGPDPPKLRLLQPAFRPIRQPVSDRLLGEKNP